jgi:hypothetical protein
MADQIANALERIAKSTSIDALRTIRDNAKGKSEVVRQAALERLIDVAASDIDDPVARDCWRMVFIVEEIRRDNGRKVWRMNKLRPKIGRDGERASIEYCAVNKTDGFKEVLDYGLPHFTAEAIVQRHPDAFSEEVRIRAAKRLEGVGINLSNLPAKYW